MLFEEIKNSSLTKKTCVFFDMDGVLAELDIDKTNDHTKEITNYYLSKRPINTIIDFVQKINKLENVEIHVLSNCHFRSQKQEKFAWLDKYVPIFEHNNIHIICYEELGEIENKRSLKAQFLKQFNEDNDCIIFLIDDDLGYLKACGPEIVKAYHLSSVLD